MDVHMDGGCQHSTRALVPGEWWQIRCVAKKATAGNSRLPASSQRQTGKESGCLKQQANRVGWADVGVLLAKCSAGETVRGTPRVHNTGRLQPICGPRCINSRRTTNMRPKNTAPARSRLAAAGDQVAHTYAPLSPRCMCGSHSARQDSTCKRHTHCTTNTRSHAHPQGTAQQALGTTLPHNRDQPAASSRRACMFRALRASLPMHAVSCRRSMRLVARSDP